MDKEIKLGHRVQKILTTKFSFEEIEEGDFEKLMNTPNGLGIDINTQMEFNKDQSTVKIDISTSLNHTLDKKKLIEHTGRTVFHVENLSKAYNEKEDKYDVPDMLINQLLGITFSHTRALLATELNSTVYRDKYFLPVINPNTLLSKKEKKGKNDS